MALDRTKYDVELDGTPFNVSLLTKSSAPDFAPRFNTGQQGENDLDLLKSKSLDSFAGGILQQQWEDDNRISFAYGIYNPVDQYFYTAPTRRYPYVVDINHDSGGGTPPSPVFCAAVMYDGILYYAVRDYDTGDAADRNYIYALDSDSGTPVELTNIPTALHEARAITHMHVFQDKIFVATSTVSGSVQPYAITPDTGDPGASTFATHGTRTAVKFATLNNKLYATLGGGPIWVNNTGTTWTLVTIVGKDSETTRLQDFVEYQNRLYIAKEDGLFAYDGNQSYKVLDNEGGGIIRTMKEYRGWLYLLSDLGLARFNGVTYERLFDFTKFLLNTYDTMIVAQDRLMFAGRFGLDPRFSTVGDPVDDANDWVGFFYYDEVGLFCYKIESFTTTQSELDIMFPAFDGWGYGKASVVHTTNSRMFFHNPADEFDVSVLGTPIDLITSIFDAGYPNVKKTLHSIELDFLLPSSGNWVRKAALEVRTKDRNGEWTDFVAVGKVDVDDGGSVLILDTPLEFYGLQIRVELHNGTEDSYGLRRLSFRYTLHPRRRMRWNVAFVCQGGVQPEPATLQDGTNETRSAKELRELIYNAHASETPVWFYEADFTRINDAGGVDNSETGNFTLDSTAMFSPEGYARIGTEIVRYSGKTATTINVIKRGVFGTSAASHSNNAVVEPAYRVYVDQIVNERYILDDNTKNDGDETEGLETEVEAVLVEV